MESRHWERQQFLLVLCYFWPESNVVISNDRRITFVLQEIPVIKRRLDAFLDLRSMSVRVEIYCGDIMEVYRADAKIVIQLQIFISERI